MSSIWLCCDCEWEGSGDGIMEDDGCENCKAQGRETGNYHCRKCLSCEVMVIGWKNDNE